MNARELISILEKIDPDTRIILQKDSEGNGYSPLYAYDNDAIYSPENAFEGDVYRTYWSADDAGLSEETWNKVLTAPKCIVLIPLT
jgi:hypothetical protein